MRNISMSMIAPVILFANLSATGQISHPEKWEYKVIQICVGASEQEMNKHGEQGWELVSSQSIEGYGNCPFYHFKRPKGTAYYAPGPPPPLPTPTCNLSLAQAPVIHGISLGMSTDELLAVFPRSKEQNDIRQALARADIEYGRTSLYFPQNAYPDSKAFVNNLSHYQFEIFDGRVNSIYVGYSFPSGIWNWDGNTWFDKISESLNLPLRENWSREHNTRSIQCQGFSASTVGSGSDAHIVIKATTPNPNDIIKGRRNAEAEKRRKEFIP